MHELDIINTYLGGHSITLSAFRKIISRLPKHEVLVVCEIGCGGGDNLRVIEQYCFKNKIDCKLIGIDINPECIEFAKERSAFKNVEWITSDYKNVSFAEKPHIIFNSLFCHHFDEDGLSEILLWMNENSSLGFFINDLHRHPFAYYSIKIITRIWSKSELVKNDASLSVLRGFSKQEFLSQLNKCNIANYDIEWKWAFRWLITSIKNG